MIPQHERGHAPVREDAMADESIPRRRFLQGVGAVGTTVAAVLGTGEAEAQSPSQAPQQPAPQAAPRTGVEPLLTLTATEADFLGAVYDTLVPADRLTPSGTDCGLVNYLDRQLAGAWGGGAKMYRAGPFRKAKPEYGYQLPLTPREFFAAGVVATNAWTGKAYGKDFDRLAPPQREAALKEMEAGKAALEDFDGKQFFEALLTITMEGFFADPIYGGNRDKAGWRMVGYPGLPAVYPTLIDEYRNKRYVVEPQSIADFS
jgi:gluconate 2-dehydrogenase gamma chain